MSQTYPPLNQSVTCPIDHRVGIIVSFAAATGGCILQKAAKLQLHQLCIRRLDREYKYRSVFSRWFQAVAVPRYQEITKKSDSYLLRDLDVIGMNLFGAMDSMHVQDQLTEIGQRAEVKYREWGGPIVWLSHFLTYLQKPT